MPSRWPRSSARSQARPKEVACLSTSLPRFPKLGSPPAPNSTVYLEHADSFASLEAAVRFVDSEVAYHAPWVLTGLVRLVSALGEADEETGIQFPEWMAALPDFLRYGVDSPELVLVNSLGLPGRGFAEWMLEQYSAARGGSPRSLNALVDWLLGSADTLAEASAERWPSFFARKLLSVAERYRRIRELLDDL